MFAGTFDPPTLGHWDVVERSAPLFDKLYIVVANNTSKNPLLSISQRLELLDELIKESPFKKKCEVVASEGLVADLCRELGVEYFVRGVRSSADFERELPMSAANEVLTKGVRTVLIPSTKEHTFVSSSMVREIFVLGGNISDFVPSKVSKFLKALKGKSKK